MNWGILSSDFNEAFDAIANAFGVTIALETALEECKEDYIDAWQEKNCSFESQYEN